MNTASGRDRSVVEACRDAARLGWAEPLAFVTKSERRQVGERNVGASRYASLGRPQWARICAEIRDATPARFQGNARQFVRIAQTEQCARVMR